MDERYPDFLRALIKEYDIKATVHLGDIFEQYQHSRWGKNPSAYGARTEILMAREQLKVLVDALSLTKVYYVLGNHDIRINKTFEEAGIPEEFMVPLKKVYGIPRNWRYMGDEFIDTRTNTGFKHGYGGSLENPISKQDAMVDNINYVEGHQHTSLMVGSYATKRKFVRYMQVGCGVDIDSYCQIYAKYNRVRQIIGAGVMLDKGKEQIWLTREMKL